MKYAIISDIHSNYEALKSVLDDIKKQNVDKTICLGDIICMDSVNKSFKEQGYDPSRF